VEPAIRDAYSVIAAGSKIATREEFGRLLSPRVAVPDEKGAMSDVPATWELWAHLMRRDHARISVRQVAADALQTARERAVCGVCGGVGVWWNMSALRVALGTVWACKECAPMVQDEVRRRAILHDGRTRGQAVAELLDSMESSTVELSPLEYRLGSR